MHASVPFLFLLSWQALRDLPGKAVQTVTAITPREGYFLFLFFLVFIYLF